MTNPSALRWDDLEIILAAFEAKSFSGAAKLLNVEQSTISRRVAAAEVLLGAPLFERTARGLIPTALATALSPHLRAAQEDLTKASTLARGLSAQPAGIVRLTMIGAVAMVLIPPHISKLRAQHPKIKLDIQTSTRPLEMREREADIALRFFKPLEPELISKVVARFELIACAHPSHLEQRGVDPTDTAACIEQLDWVIPNAPPGPSHEPGPELAWFQHHVMADAALMTNSYALSLELVRDGAGAALIPAVWVERLGLRALALPPGPELTLWMVALASALQIPAIQAVWRWLDESFDELGSKR